MRPTRDFPAWYRKVWQDTLDEQALETYLAGLSEADRITYYKQNPDYMLGSTPAHVYVEAQAIGDAQGGLAADAYIRDYDARMVDEKCARWAADHAPSVGMRIGAALGAIVVRIPIVALVSLAAHAVLPLAAAHVVGYLSLAWVAFWAMTKAVVVVKP